MSVTVTPYFKPTSITGCSVWLDASDTTTITSSSGTLSQWRDKSTNALVMGQLASTAFPTVSTAVSPNGLQTVNFTSSQSLASTGNLTLNGPVSIFIVFNAPSGSSMFFLEHGFSGSGTTLASGFYIFGGNGTYWDLKRNGTERCASIGTVGSAVFSNNTWYQTGFVDADTTTNTSDLAITRNGSSLTPSWYNAGQGLGSVATGSYSAPFYINPTTHVATATYYGEIIIYNAALSVADRQKVEAYLSQKWALTSSLPAGHPGVNSILYRSSIPTPVKVTGYNSVSYTFAPTQITGCQLWLDAADSSTVTGTTSVTAWTDKSGNANNTTVVNAAVGSPVAPSYSTNSINGLSAITMSGTSFFTGSTNVNSTTLTCFFVGNCVFGTGGSSQQRILGLGVTGLDDYSSTLRPIPLSVISGGTQLLAYRNANMASATVVSGTNFIGCCLFDGTSNYMYKNGTLGTQVASSGTFTTSIYGVGSDAGTQYMFGASSLGTNCLVGKIGEMLLFNTALITLQRQQVEAYLAQKWGLTSSLAAAHPGLTTTYFVNQLFLSRASRTIPINVFSQPKYTTSGLIFHLDAGIAASYSGSGSTWNDLAGSGLTTTLYNSPTYSSANGGYIAFVPSSSQYAQTSASLGSRSRWTVEVWHYYNATNNGGYGCIVVENYNPGSQINFLIGPPNSGSSTTLSTGYWNGSSWQATTNGYSLPSNGWYHIVGTYDGTNLNLYVNGTLTQVQASAGTPASSGLGIRFMRRWDNAEYWGGYLSIVRIYNRALSLSEVGVNYNGSRTRFTNPVPPT